MKYLLDTHIYLWYVEGSAKISSETVEIIQSRDNKVFLHIVSFREAVIKASLHKLDLSCSLNTVFEKRNEAAIELLSITEEQLFQLKALPLHHRDPFDRLIIATAIADNLTVITHDKQFRGYDVKLIK